MTTTTAKPLADGIYFGLDEDTYHGDSALGSSNLRAVLKGPNEYWWDSPMNPKRPVERVTEGKILGKAIHKLLLEGATAFNPIYVRGPWSESTHADLTPSEKGQLTKQAKAKLREHQSLLHADDFDFIVAIRAIIDEDPELKGCLDNGPSEVSVFWTRKDGTRLKCRFDKLKLRGYGDIKSIANERGDELGSACRYSIFKYRYDIQIEHYNEGRMMLPSLADKLFFATTPMAEALKDCDNQARAAIEASHQFIHKVADTQQFAAQMVFIPKSGAPDAWSTVISPANPILKPARDDIETALMIYRDSMKKFGTTKRWLPGRVVSELAIEEMPFGISRRVS